MELFDAHEQKHIDASLLLAVAMQRGVVLGEAVRIPFARRRRLRGRTPPVADAFSRPQDVSRLMRRSRALLAIAVQNCDAEHLVSLIQTTIIADPENVRASLV